HNQSDTSSDENKHSHSIFLSYCSEDRAFVQEIAARLRAHGLKPWLDVEQIRPGENWRSNIEEAIKHAKVAVVLLRPQANLNQWAAEELDNAELQAKIHSALLAYLPQAQRKMALQQARTTAQAIDNADTRAKILSALLPYLPEAQRDMALQQALTTA